MRGKWRGQKVNGVAGGATSAKAKERRPASEVGYTENQGLARRETASTSK